MNRIKIHCKGDEISSKGKVDFTKIAFALQML